jgi:hypothetical protein
MDTACWHRNARVFIAGQNPDRQAYSKQIEYSEENLLHFQQASWEQPFSFRAAAGRAFDAMGIAAFAGLRTADGGGCARCDTAFGCGGTSALRA